MKDDFFLLRYALSKILCRRASESVLNVVPIVGILDRYSLSSAGRFLRKDFGYYCMRASRPQFED